MRKEKVRVLHSDENDALYWTLRFAQRNPDAVGLDEEELKGVNELYKFFKSGNFRISDNKSIID